MQWRRCLEQIRDRNGALEIAIKRTPTEGEDVARQLVWRVRVLALTDAEIIVDQPTALGRAIELEPGLELDAVMTVGQNRWRFETKVCGNTTATAGSPRQVPAIRIEMPESVRRCQRRSHQRVAPGVISLPEVLIWPLLDPKSVIPAERANELAFQQGASGTGPARVDLEAADIMPEVGPRFSGLLVNLGGGGIGLQIPPEHGQILSRHRLFWLRVDLLPELETPICASAKLAHTHMQSDQHYYAGLAFDFTFNPGHQRFVVEQICRYIGNRQRDQLAHATAVLKRAG